jgi:uncharacterized damage-inducible protein DinB
MMRFVEELVNVDASSVDWRERPSREEHPDSTAELMKKLDPGCSLIEQFEKNLHSLEELLGNLADEFCEQPYGPGKWSIKDTVQHLSDDERIYVYRALRFARGDRTELPGFDQDLFAGHAKANERSMEELLAEFRGVRRSTISFFESLDEASTLRRGRADGHEFSVRALGFHIAGHEAHHLEILRQFIEREDRGD